MENQFERAMQFLYGRINYEGLQTPTKQYPFRLARMRALLRQLENPDQGLAVVHIGGTKGKGSTATMVAAMLSAGGYQTGLYTSPHLNQLGERFRVDGAICSQDDLVDLVEQVRQAAERLEADGRGSATFFELTTAIALLHFRRRGCQVAVLEVGLGGRLDSTNVCQPLVTAITSVGLDHQHILGNTVAEIAAEKAGILKPGVLMVSGVADGPAAAVIATQAKRVGSPLWTLGHDFDVTVDSARAEWGTGFDYRSQLADSHDRHRWQVPLEGQHQGRNAAIALAVIDALAAGAGISVSPGDQQRGLSQTVCPARVERFERQPTVILDAAHNVDSIAALCAVVRRRSAGRKTVVVFGTSHDKDALAQLQQLVSIAEELVLTRFHGNPRWRDPVELAQIATACSTGRPVPQRIIAEPAAALQAACDAAGPDGLVVVCGSFFLAAEVRPLLLRT